MSMPVYCQPDAFNTFREQLPELESSQGLFRAACAIALHEHPMMDIARAEAIVDELGRAVSSRVRSPNKEARLAHLHDVLFDVVGFVGNVEDYYNTANSYVPEVLATKRGLPITLVLIYKCVAERIGLTVHGINSPGHFLAAVECGEYGGTIPGGRRRLMFIDPFYGGGLLDEEGIHRRIAETTGIQERPNPLWLEQATHRQWLGRILNNLQAVFAHGGRERDLLAMQELQELLTR